MPSEAVALMGGPGVMRYETPWQRLPWTGPLAVTAWFLVFWGLSILIEQRPTAPERVLPVDARIIELPEPPPPKIEPVDRPAPSPVPSTKPTPAPRKASTPALASSDMQPSTEPAVDASTSSALPTQGSAAPQVVAGAAPSSGSGSARHPRTNVREAPVGVTGRPLPVNIHNEDNPIDDGTGGGLSPGGWSQEYSEGCLNLPGDAGPCTTGRVFAQPGRPWCYDANPIYGWDIGTCSYQLYKATEAYKRADYTTAIEGLKKLAEKDYAPAQFSLGSMYEEGIGLPKDEEQAAHWYRKAATAGEVKAEYNLAMMYSDGRGVKKDDQQAAHWYTKASYHGYDSAQYNLGVMYATGTGVPKNDKEASYWYLKASHRGNAHAQYNLAVNYENGVGRARDEKEAAYWYCKAAGRGLAEARHSLGLLYANGGEVPKYEELAYFCWFFSVDKRNNQLGYQGREKYTKVLTEEQQAYTEATYKRFRF
ncbi:MAG: SEL1-like repeat protein [Burkholderiales bacterium]|nr:SEL1-like repeat protein [Burkholderiales bacterium]